MNQVVLRGRNEIPIQERRPDLVDLNRHVSGTAGWKRALDADARHAGRRDDDGSTEGGR